MDAEISLRVDGQAHRLTVDTRTTLLDALRERLGVTSPKKGCDHGQCGACTVLLDGRRHLTCLSLAVAHDGAEITTADGLAPAGELHPVQQAFLDRDAFQCGYCTPARSARRPACWTRSPAAGPATPARTSPPIRS